MATFASTTDRTFHGYASLLGGLFLVLVSVGGFLLALKTSPGPLRFHSMTTLPMIFAVGLFVRGYSALRSPSRVIVANDELVVLGGKSEFGRWKWEEISLAATEDATMGAQRLLKVYGADGKPLVKLTSDLARFDRMVALIKHRIAEHPSPQAEIGALRKARRNGIFLILAGTAFVGLSAANMWIAINDQEKAELLANSAVPAEAVIVRKFTAPNGHTRRIEYRVNAPNAPLENVEVEPTLWHLLQQNQSIPVIMAKDRPEISRLTLGQTEDGMKTDPRLMMGLSALIGLLALSMIVAGLLALNGRDVKWDSKGLRLAHIGRE